MYFEKGSLLWTQVRQDCHGSVWKWEGVFLQKKRILIIEIISTIEKHLGPFNKKIIDPSK